MSHEGLDGIISKAKMIRMSEHITPREFWLADLVEALALELRAHIVSSTHVSVIGAPPTGGISLLDKDLATRPAYLSDPVPLDGGMPQ